MITLVVELFVFLRFRSTFLLSLSGEGDDFISTWDEVHETFDVMNLHENLLRGIYAYGRLVMTSVFFFKLRVLRLI